MISAAPDYTREEIEMRDISIKMEEKRMAIELFKSFSDGSKSVALFKECLAMIQGEDK